MTYPWGKGDGKMNLTGSEGEVFPGELVNFMGRIPDADAG